MDRNEFMRWLADRKCVLGMWNVAVDGENMSEYTIGCFFNSNSGKWEVYVNKERGKHRVKLETSNEQQAFDRLRSLVEYTIENNRGYC